MIFSTPANTSDLYFVDKLTDCFCYYFLLLQDHESVIKAIYTGSEFLESYTTGNEVGIVLESTSFYAEQGGQVSCC